MSDILIIAACVLAGLAILYGLYLYVRVIIPLRKIKKLTERIREGNFEELPEPDGSKAFGMFSESFYAMYEELQKSRQREIALKNKELEVFESLSKKLSEPVTGIKLTAEMLRTKLLTEKSGDTDPYVLDKLDSIYNRADQTGVILNTLLSTALDGFGEFMVRCSATESRVLEDMVKKYDYRHVVQMSTVPYVLIHIDERRMGQVIGNIIDNSYKYANTDISVAFLLTDDYLQMKISDNGPGVAADEIALLTDRFYRTRKAADGTEEGSGLGLYVAKAIMQNMDGNLVVANTQDGFCVTLLIKLS